MNPRRKKRLGVVLAILFGLSATIGLIIYALNQNMDLFYTPTELVYGKEGKSRKSASVYVLAVWWWKVR